MKKFIWSLISGLLVTASVQAQTNLIVSAKTVCTNYTLTQFDCQVIAYPTNQVINITLPSTASVSNGTVCMVKNNGPLGYFVIVQATSGDFVTTRSSSGLATNVGLSQYLGYMLISDNVGHFWHGY